MPDAAPYTAPQGATFWQKLGPGGAGSLLAALLSGLLLVPVYLRFRQVLAAREGDLPVPSDAILVLGRRLKENQVTPVFAARLAWAAELWRGGLAPKVVVAGGLTGKAQRSEAEAGIAWLLGRGLTESAVLAEDRSQHTLENLYFVRDLARSRSWGPLLLVSDPLHVARAKAMARGLGLPVRCVPARACPPPPGSIGWWGRAMLEAFLLHWYHTGMATSRFMGSDRQLKRVT